MKTDWSFWAMLGACLLSLGVVVAASCTPSQLNKAQAAVDAKTYTCRYLELQDASDPRIAKGLKLCRTDAEIRQILAVLAGDACLEARE